MNAEAPSFLVLDCEKCGSTVLSGRDFRDGEVVDICIQCDARVDVQSDSARWVSAADVVELGYTIQGVNDASSEQSRGCRDGRCGIAQPK
jgi:hypothetical protein